MSKPSLRLANPNPVEGAPPAAQAVPAVEPLLWGWPEIEERFPGISRRTIERQLSVGRFPQPTRRIGTRPFWSPEVIQRWARGGRNG